MTAWLLEQETEDYLHDKGFLIKVPASWRGQRVEADAVGGGSRGGCAGLQAEGGGV